MRYYRAMVGIVMLAASALAAVENLTPKRQTREDVFEFVEKPKIEKKGDGYLISFASKSQCDATVAIIGPDGPSTTSAGSGQAGSGRGKVVRHLASGVLGPNAPAPFKANSLSQAIEWDGKDDHGKPVPEGCKVKVGLGLKAEYERQLCFDPYDFPGKKPWACIMGLACDRDGLLYVFGNGIIRAFDKDGKYVKSLAPHPGNLPPEDVVAYSFYPTTYGDKTIISPDKYGPFNSGVSGAIGTAAHSPAAGRLLTLFFNSDSRSATWLFKFRPDGALGAGDRIKFGKHKQGFLGLGMAHVAASPDGKTVYVGVDARQVTRGAYKGRGGGFENAVYRFAIDDLKGPRMELGSPFVGESGKAGTDDKHLNGVCGVAADAEGNLYVSDFGNNRIQVFGSDGVLARSIPIVEPKMIYVHPKTGVLYCMTGRASKKPRVNTMRIVKLSSQGQVQAEFKLPSPGNMLEVTEATFCLDPAGDPPGLWVRSVSGYSGIPPVFRLEDRGSEFVKTVTLPGAQKYGPGKWRNPRMAVDPKHEDLYVICGRLARFNGKTGELDAAFDKFGKTIRAESVYVAEDGLIYARVGNPVIYGQFVIRFDRNGNPVDFPQGTPLPKGFGPGSFVAKGYKAIWTGECSESNVHQKGLTVSANGDVYAVVTGARKQWFELRTGGSPEPDDAVAKFLTNRDIRHDRIGLGHKPLIRVWDKNGKEKALNATPGGVGVHGIRADRDGCLYIASLYLRPTGEKKPDGLAKSPRQHTVGSILKLGDGTGTQPVARFWGAKDEGKPDGPSPFYDGGNWGSGKAKLWCDNWNWIYWGMSSLAVNCTCHHGRFDIDGHARIFIPAMHLFSVMVLDTNGNRILRIGRYGNADSQGSSSLVPDPDIGFAWVRAVVASDTAIYAMDYGNKRILKAALAYEVEETVPMP